MNTVTKTRCKKVASLSSLKKIQINPLSKITNKILPTCIFIQVSKLPIQQVVVKRPHLPRSNL